jgi:hypothetical protein
MFAFGGQRVPGGTRLSPSRYAKHPSYTVRTSALSRVRPPSSKQWREIHSR